MTSLPRTTPELDALVGMFYPSVAALGQFEEVTAAELSSVAKALLDHDQHMTLTVEAHHGTPVDLQVLESNVVATHYARKILLRRRSDNEVVQYGIVRLHLDSLNATVREEVNGQDIPLGRILIQHNILRMVRLLSLWRILPAEELCGMFSLDQPQVCFGRTALIYCDTVPAVELLEIVRPFPV